MHYDMPRIAEALSVIRVTKAMPEEYELHAAVAEALSAAGMRFEHEARLAPRCRIDFLCGDTGIEIKKGRVPYARLMAQCERYLACGSVSELIVIAPVTLRIPEKVCGKRVMVLALDRLWGVAV